ncbi:hypothetical protein E2C01_081101 [Portunus trituberculatus]|uniref:Uncharacterized protein n=1 Tax=Portunus trituberculatus TaxID=210409 RepID=A0A5B7J065_PORTR|nr:hypothetical protein [Portunus trituberculatus]
MLIRCEGSTNTTPATRMLSHCCFGRLERLHASYVGIRMLAAQHGNAASRNKTDNSDLPDAAEADGNHRPTLVPELCTSHLFCGFSPATLCIQGNLLSVNHNKGQQLTGFTD